MRPTRTQLAAAAAVEAKKVARIRAHHEEPRNAEVRLAEPSEVSVEFLQGMADRMATSMYKYGPWALNAGSEDIRAQVSLRWQCYEHTGNTEWLMDVANLAMMEFMRPQHPAAFFKATSAEESPGLITIDGWRTHKGEDSPA